MSDDKQPCPSFLIKKIEELTKGETIYMSGLIPEIEDVLKKHAVSHGFFANSLFEKNPFSVSNVTFTLIVTKETDFKKLCKNCHHSMRRILLNGINYSCVTNDCPESPFKSLNMSTIDLCKRTLLRWKCDGCYVDIDSQNGHIVVGGKFTLLFCSGCLNKNVRRVLEEQ